MRYYNLIITDPNTGAVLRQWTSFVNGVTIPGALNIELDVPTYTLAQPMGSAYVKIWGISIEDILQASDLNDMNIQLFAGMQAGLPLANPTQAGLILEGTIQQCFGNWQAEVQTLDIVALVSSGSATAPKNIVNIWPAGQPLATSIQNTLAVAFPDYTATINISPNLVLAHDEPAYFQTLSQFAQFIKQASQRIIGGTYNGVDIVIRNKEFLVYDGTTPTSPIALNFTDMIGQPTWIGPATVQTRLVLRADLQVSDYIQMPQGQQTLTAQSLARYRTNPTFQGVFQAIRVRHIGNFRQPDANSWVTVVDAIST
jgi:hypothetical protein